MDSNNFNGNRICIRCGTTVNVNNRFCPNCGNDFYLGNNNDNDNDRTVMTVTGSSNVSANMSGISDFYPGNITTNVDNNYSNSTSFGGTNNNNFENYNKTSFNTGISNNPGDNDYEKNMMPLIIVMIAVIIIFQ